MYHASKNIINHSDNTGRDELDRKSDRIPSQKLEYAIRARGTFTADTVHAKSLGNITKIDRRQGQTYTKNKRCFLWNNVV